MKKHILTAAIICNLIILGILVWKHFDENTELREMSSAAMRCDEIHLSVHAMSLKALESDDTELAKETARRLRMIVEAGELNIEARDRAGFDR